MHESATDYPSTDERGEFFSVAMGPSIVTRSTARDSREKAKRLTGKVGSGVAVNVADAVEDAGNPWGPNRLSHGRCGEGLREASGRLLEAFPFRTHSIKLRYSPEDPEPEPEPEPLGKIPEIR